MKYTGLALLLLASASPAGAEEIKPISVPFELLRTNHMAVKIMVNGKGPYRVIFDTGAPMNLLNNKIAKEAELKPDMAGGFALFGMRGKAKVKTLELGDLKAEDTSVVVMDHPALTAVSKVLGPLDGIIGFPFFARYAMTLDYQAKTMTFIPVDYQPGDVLDSMMLMMLNRQQKPPARVYAPPAVWGFVVEKDKADEAPGVTIKQVLASSAAEAAGVKAGDRLLVLDAHWTDSLVDCHRAASGVRPGQTVKAKLKRGDKEIEVSMTPKAGL